MKLLRGKLNSLSSLPISLATKFDDCLDFLLLGNEHTDTFPGKLRTPGPNEHLMMTQGCEMKIIEIASESFY